MPHMTGKSGIHWYYEIEGEGEILLFFHGWGVDKRIWRQQSKFFSQMYKVVTIDLPGHGKSSYERVSFTEMVRDIREITEQLGLNNLSIVGSSLGGMFGLKLYALMPEKVKRIVFVGSMPKFAQSEGYPHGLDVVKMRKLGGQLETSYPSIVNVFFRSLFTKEERASRRYKWLQKFKQTDDAPMKQALTEYLDLLEKEDLREDLKQVRCPMQFINGSGDEICTPLTVDYLKTLAPQARFDEFAECGHFPFLSKPHEFNQILEDFLCST